MAELAAAALAYAARGISVFPLLPKSKAPMVANGFQQASADAAKVRAWWRKRADCNIGIATGAPAGFWVLDVDGEAAEAALAALEAQHGPLPVTVQQTTGRGRHICFRWDPDGPEMRNRSKVGGADIDVRGNGGYIVAPPSVHPGDERKGVPPGRIYAWSWGRSPEDVDFADAPAWLVELCRPRDQAAAAAPARAAEPRAEAGGRATRYGEAVLDSCLKAIGAAQKGARDSTLYRFACKAAGLVPTGHLERGYLRDELVRAGGVHVPDAMTQAQLERQVERALAWGEGHAWGPDPARRARPLAGLAPAAVSPVAAAIARAGAVDFLHGLPTPAVGGLFDGWLRFLKLEREGLPGAFGRFRALKVHGLGCVALPLQLGPDAEADGAAVFSLPAEGRCVALKGLHQGRVGILAWPEGADQVLVATDLADAWALGEAAFASGDPMAVVVAPRLSTFAGAPAGDRWARVSPELPALDPERPAWTWPGMKAVYLAVRRDLAGPEMKARKQQGGTKRVQLSGDDAARFWGGLACASWRAAGANAVRVVSPPAGAGGFVSVGG